MHKRCGSYKMNGVELCYYLFWLFNFSLPGRDLSHLFFSPPLLSFDVQKRSLAYITFGDLVYCAGQLMSQWTAVGRGEFTV